MVQVEQAFWSSACALLLKPRTPLQTVDSFVMESSLVLETCCSMRWNFSCRRMNEVKARETRDMVEDLMYLSVLEKFVTLEVSPCDALLPPRNTNAVQPRLK